MPETTPLIKAALNLRGGAGFDVYIFSTIVLSFIIKITQYYIIVASFPDKIKRIG